jgi:hypothetical protein
MRPEAERFGIDGLRAMPPWQKLEIVGGLNRAAKPDACPPFWLPHRAAGSRPRS